MPMELDHLDRIAADAFDGYIVRKDLVRKFARQYPVPTYVCEFLLGRYCASINEEEIQEGLQIVERQLRDRAVRSGEEELFKSRARETGSVKIIDIISARLDAKTDSYLATLPSLQLKDVCIESKLVNDNERMLTGGFYAEVDLEYDASIAQEKNGSPFSIAAMRPIQLSKRDVLNALYDGRKQFTTAEWKHFLLRSIGLEPSNLTERTDRRDAAPHGPVRREQLQPGRAWPARHGQEPPLPADFALRPPRQRRQGDGRPDVREQRHRPAWAGLPVRRGLLR